ncbi:CH-like domain in sperm protein domain-containing protein [Ditylenchus destructor]|uniref:CH-like domain in sperm protein domain-containing protein n=1 Tax=Ditylenchus destructor TaxID=166010 RepID=A0AAD4R8S9_9BILA|nr:CH-like domain in sperm protein domain-containing protein [Ditylenchus destructor]
MSSDVDFNTELVTSSVLHDWIRGMALSKPVRNLARDFSDGVLVAEIIAHFLPRYVSLGNFGHVNSVALKRYNWETLQKVVLRHLRIQLTAEQMNQLANSVPGVIDGLLLEVKSRIEDAIQEGRFRPTNRRSRSYASSNASSRGGSTLHLAQLDDPVSSRHYNRDASTIGNAKHSPNTAHDEGTKLSRTQPAPVLDDFTKDQLIEKLYIRIRHLENSLRQKDDKISHLANQNEKLLEIARQSSHKLLQNHSNPDSPSASRGTNSEFSDSITDLDRLNGAELNNGFRRYR